MKSKLIRLLSVFGATAILSASVTNTTLAESYSINSYGVIQDSDSNVVIDADDIRQNYQAIQQLKKQLAALEGRSLQWSNDLQTYVIVTYELDDDGNIVYEETTDSATGETIQTPKIASTEALGALGTADPTMVVENRTFSSLYAKTVYSGSNTTKSPGVQQNGTLIDVLTNGWLASDLSTPYYATSDTEGTGSSTRAKDESVDSSTRTHTLTAIAYTADAEKAGDDGSISLEECGPTLDTTNTTLTVGISESVTLPAGYYSDSVTVNNGVVNKGSVSINFTKAIQSATLDSGYYSGISIDVKGLYDIGYFEGLQTTKETEAYSTIVVNPGEHGVFTDDESTEARTFTGPSYTGFTMDVSAVGAYKLTGWDTTIDTDRTITMTAHWVEDEIVSTTISSFKSGSYYFGKDYVSSITISAQNSLTISTSDGKGGVFTDNENQVTNSSRSVTASASYDLYVNGKYWKTISCSDTYTGYGTKTEVTTIWDSGHKLYSYAYGWAADAETTVTFDEPVRYLAIVANSVERNADVTIERYIDE